MADAAIRLGYLSVEPMMVVPLYVCLPTCVCMCVVCLTRRAPGPMACGIHAGGASADDSPPGRQRAAHRPPSTVRQAFTAPSVPLFAQVSTYQFFIYSKIAVSVPVVDLLYLPASLYVSMQHRSYSR